MDILFQFPITIIAILVSNRCVDKMSSLYNETLEKVFASLLRIQKQGHIYHLINNETL